MYYRPTNRSLYLPEIKRYFLALLAVRYHRNHPIRFVVLVIRFQHKTLNNCESISDLRKTMHLDNIITDGVGGIKAFLLLSFLYFSSCIF